MVITDQLRRLCHDSRLSALSMQDRDKDTFHRKLIMIKESDMFITPSTSFHCVQFMLMSQSDHYSGNVSH